MIIIVVAYEILHRVVGEKFLEFTAQLGSQGLVGRQYQGGALDGLDHLGHGIGFTSACGPQQNLPPVPPLQALNQGSDGPGLVPPGTVFRF
ncbi:MAG: hypothetical protein BWY80_01108 [Firmicutes bacterium ADurb.Bin456]|nr:MAG: hypothetical protein BWY80_01108 [Firmicutes bacterium ADurb.Bin456]